MKTAVLFTGLLLLLGVLPIQGQIPQTISYQGRLTQSGGGIVPDGSYSVMFRLYAASSGGVAQWSETQTVTAKQGLFTATLGSITPLTLAFNQPYWLGISVAGGAEMTPRKALAAAPYALMASSVAVPLSLTGNISYPGSVVKAENTSGGDAVFGKGNTGNGVLGESNLGPGVTGNSNTLNGVAARSQQGDALLAITFNANRSAGVFANGPLHDSAFLAGPAAGVYGVSVDSAGVKGRSTNNYGVFGEHTGALDYGVGVMGYNAGSGPGVSARADANDDYTAGMIGCHTTATRPGVFGYTGTFPLVPAVDAGVYGASNSGTGVHGYSFSGDGLFGEASADYKSGIFAINTNSNGYAGYFTGRVHVNGTLSKSAGSFRIDHPLDPANKYLQHSFVESPDMMNVYNGNITTDGSGVAVVTLPAYCEALNRDFRYQLTVIGQFAQAIVAEKINSNRFTIKTDEALNKDFRYQLTCIGGFAPVYISQKVTGNRFSIAGGISGMEVSWQVTGIRHDAYADAHRLQIEIDKAGSDRGKYLSPLEHQVQGTLGIYHERTERFRSAETLHQEN